jgi:aldose sugar dehydrogenase
MKQIPLALPVLVILTIGGCKPSSTREKYVDSSQAAAAASIKVELVAEGLYVPWSIIFTDPHRILLTERNGKLRQIVKGQLDNKPVKVFEDVSADGEQGLMGLVLDPSYASNKFLYVSYAYKTGGDMYAKIVRYIDEGTSLSSEKIILDRIPAADNHAGCRLRFGPDGKLYSTTGDAKDRKLAQDINNLHGKLLRINADGTIPSDNPFPNNPVWSYGHRNAQGIDWYPGTDILYSTEHGPSGFDGPGGGDEVNIIEKGKNYGWPEVSHEKTKQGMESPKLVFTPAIAPASGMFYRSGVIPEFKNNFFFGCLRGSGIMRLIIDPNDPRKIISHQMMPEIDFGRIRDVAEGPDGAIYFSTSNQDGRGNPRSGDDKIYRIVKK